MRFRVLGTGCGPANALACGAVVCVEHDKAKQVVALKEIVPGAQARVMAEDGAGSIWVSDSAGSVFQIQDEKARACGANQGLPAQGICWLAVDGQGQLWFSQ